MNKYKNKKTEVDGKLFDSKKEAKYYMYLKELEDRGKIKDLRRQVRYELVPAVYREEVKHLKTKDKIVNRCIQRPICYDADFVYIDNDDDKEYVIDVKGGRATQTPVFKLKRKMMLALKGIQVIIV